MTLEVSDLSRAHFSSQVPHVDKIYDLKQDQFLLYQERNESAVRSYPRRLPITIKSAYGALVEDTYGHIFLDCLAGSGSLALGHNHPEINQALKEHLDSGFPHQTLDITTPVKCNYIEQVKKFLPSKLSNDCVIQFCGPSGADAVEAAIKLAKKATGRNTMVAFRGAYHGMTNGTMGVMGNLGIKSPRTGLMSDVHFMPFPYSLRCPFGLGGDEGACASIRYIERLLSDDESGIKKPAAIIVEPIQGEGGVVPAPSFWLRDLRRICDESGILLVLDEIQCGVGRTGSNFAFEESGITPDILCLSKAVGGGLPMAILVMKRSSDVWSPGEHTGTFRGNQLAMVSGAKTLEILQRDQLVEHAAIAGRYFLEGLEKIQRKVSCIAEVRGRGLMLGIEIQDALGALNKFGEPKADSSLTQRIQKAALERGLIVEVGGRGRSVIRFLPPIIISGEQIAFALRVLEESIIVSSGVNPRQNHQKKWRKYFIQTGAHGSDSLVDAMHRTTSMLRSVFEQAESPYSGREPHDLEKKINQVSFNHDGASLKSVLSSTVDMVARDSIIVQNPHCIAHLHTPPVVASVAAEAIIGALNQSMDSWDQAPAATYVEQRIIDWICSEYQLGINADGVMTSGGTQSNQVGLLMARDWISEKISGHSIRELGLPEYASSLAIVCSENAHFTIKKSASLLGLGERSVLTVPAKKDGTMDVSKINGVIENFKARGGIPFAIVGTAGTTDHGAVDDLSYIAEVAERYKIWMHIDGSYGGALVLSRHRDRLSGAKWAKSISVDFHKLFYQTISCGALLVSDKTVLEYLSYNSDYLNRKHDTLPNLVSKSIATTRRFDALKMFITLQSIGKRELGYMYDHLIEQTQEVAKRMARNKLFELLVPPSLSTILFRVINSTAADIDRLNQRIRVEALIRGVAVLGETIVSGRTALKLTILNPCLTMRDFDILLSRIEALASELGQQ